MSSMCSVEGCDRPLATSGLCSGHYARWRKHGDVAPDRPIGSMFARTQRDPEGIFWSKVDRTGECWEWTGYVTPRGYGIFNSRRLRSQWGTIFAHRISWSLVHGPIPDGHVLDHVCRNRRCVRPDPGHLRVVTRAMNNSENHGWSNQDTCPNGHERTDENTYVSPSGKRQCRTCGNARAREYKARKRASNQ